MIRSLAPAAVLLAAAAAAGSARAATAADCAGFTAIVPAVRAASAEAAGEDGCVFHDVMFTLGRFQRLHADAITVHRVDFARLEKHQFPLSLRIEATGASFRAGIDNPVMNYISSITARPFNAVIDYGFDSDTGPFRLAQFSIDGEALGSLRVSAEVDGLGPGLFVSHHDNAAETLSLRAVGLRFENKGMFEVFAVPALAGLLLTDAPDPPARVEGLKAEAIAVEEKRLGEAGVAADVAKAIGRFIADLPHPAGTLTVTGDFPRPIALADMHALREGRTPNLTDQRSLTATYP